MGTDKTMCSNGCDFDVAIIGGGPTGVAAAISLKYEGPRVVLLAENGLGGQVAGSPKIQNVFGVPVDGISGSELMGRGIDQANYFDVKLRSPFRAVRIAKGTDGLISVIAANRERIKATAVVLALGASHRRLNAEGIEQFMGRGVAYGPPQYQIPEQWHGKHVGIVGGGNSAGQVALFLSACTGCQVHVFVRGKGLEDGMSNYLIENMKEADNVKVYPHSKLKKVNGNEERIQSVDVECDGKVISVPLDYLSIQIGAEPQTGWLEEDIALDKRGFILTDRDLPLDKWPENVGRAPFRFETSMPGVFTGGDVHAEVPNRMSCAIGEGAILSVSVFRYLMTMYEKKK